MKCPFCAEPIDADAVDCPECGEALDDDGGYAPSSSSGGGATVIIVIAVIAVLLVCGTGILATLLMPALMKAKSKAGKTKCANNLRQFGLAALQYGDDKRFFPHVGPLDQLDGDIGTNDTPKKARAMMWYGYHDNPEGWICPESFDMFIPASAQVYNNQRTWFWDGQASGSTTLSPFVDGANDPVLSETFELSYGWTRKGMNTNVRSTAILGADRAARESGPMGTDALLGNHEGAWNVLRADATVSYESIDMDPSLGAMLGGTQTKQDGYLSVKIQDDPSVFR